MKHPVFNLLTRDDRYRSIDYLGTYRDPDLTIAPDGSPYLYRWYVVPRNKVANAYFHIQVASDPERPLHDHPWDNVSNILSGGYTELSWHPGEILGSFCTTTYKAGTIIMRRAAEAHRLILPAGVPYTMTLFMTGPKIREWGYWYPDGWHHNKRHTADRDGISVFTEEDQHGR